MTEDILEQAYTVIGFEFTEKDYYRYATYQNLLNSLPDNVAWYGPGSLMDHVLASRYNAVIVDGWFRFKTDGDKTFFLLRFS